MKTRIIFASLILGLGLTASPADAATTTNPDDSPATNKPASVMLVNNTQVAFAAYMGKNFVKFVQTTNWKNFANVVSLYDRRPAAVLTLSPAERVAFNQAVAQVNTQLAKQNNAEANRWMTQADYTARMINFLWNAAESNREDVDLQPVKINAEFSE